MAARAEPASTAAPGAAPTAPPSWRNAGPDPDEASGAEASRPGGVTHRSPDPALPWREELRRAALPLVFATAWVVWAYLRLRPTAAVTNTTPPLRNYGPWAWNRLAYSDLLALYRVHHLANHAFPYVHTVIEYPVVTGLYMWLAAWFPGPGGYFLVSCVGLLVCTLASVVFLRRLSPRAGWIFALSPLLLTYALLNWDMLGIAFMLAGWDRFRVGRYRVAGVLFALGVCTKLFPVVLLLYALVSCFAAGADDERRAGGRQLLWSAVVTGLVLNVPFILLNARNWGEFFGFNAGRGGGGGVFYELRLVSTWPIAGVDVLSVLTMLAVFGYLAWTVYRGTPPLVAAAAGLTIFMLVNKVFSPQYMLWVLVVGIMAEWPGWTLATVTVAGLVDYVDAWTALHLAPTHAPAWTWFYRTVFPLNRALRMVAMALGLAASTAQHWTWARVRWARWRPWDQMASSAP